MACTIPGPIIKLSNDGKSVTKKRVSKEEFNKIWNEPTCKYQVKKEKNGIRRIICSNTITMPKGEKVHMLCPLWDKESCPTYIKLTNPELYKKIQDEDFESEYGELKETDPEIYEYIKSRR